MLLCISNVSILNEIMNLLIVESPNKIKTLKQILGADWTIAASFGHITELAHAGENNLGFTIDDQGMATGYV